MVNYKLFLSAIEKIHLRIKIKQLGKAFHISFFLLEPQWLLPFPWWKVSKNHCLQYSMTH